MTLVTLCSAKASPGVTTLACVIGAVWPADRAVLVAECDPSGGDLAARFGLSTRVGMTSLILTERQRGPQATDHGAHTQRLPGGLDVLVGPSGADSAMALDRELGTSPADLVSDDCDMLADCGQLLPGAIGQEKIIRAADRVFLLVRPDVSGVAHAQWAVSRVHDLVLADLSVLIAGPGEFTSVEIARALDVEVQGTVPFDPRAAVMARGGPGRAKEFSRSALVAFAREIVRKLLDDGSLDSDRHDIAPEEAQKRGGSDVRPQDRDGWNPVSVTAGSFLDRHRRPTRSVVP